MLPDTLPHGLVAQDNLDGAQGRALRRRPRIPAAEGLEEIYGAPAAVRGYAAEGRPVQATITVLDQAPGLFDPHGPPIDPEVLGLERSVYELRRVGDAVCDLFWQRDRAAGRSGRRVRPTRPPLQCQLGDGDRTIELFASGLSLHDAIDVLESLASDLTHDQ